MSYQKPERIITYNEKVFERMCEALKKSEHIKWHYESQGSMYANDRNISGSKQFIWKNTLTGEEKIIRYERK
jgi:hypothetical protein